MHVSLVDRILTVSSLKEIRAVKNLSFREDYLRDHFPGFPLMPGALQVEAMIQAAQWLLRSSLDFPRADFAPVAVSNARYSKYVRPGDSLILTVSLVKQLENGYRFRGTGEVAGERTAQAQFELVPYSASWTQGVSDQLANELLQRQRDLFARLSQVPARYPTSSPDQALRVQP